MIKLLSNMASITLNLHTDLTLVFLKLPNTTLSTHPLDILRERKKRLQLPSHTIPGRIQNQHQLNKMLSIRLAGTAHPCNTLHLKLPSSQPPASLSSESAKSRDPLFLMETSSLRNCQTRPPYIRLTLKVLLKDKNFRFRSNKWEKLAVVKE